MGGSGGIFNPGVAGNIPLATLAVQKHQTPEQAEALVVLFERIAAEQGWQPGGALRAYSSRSVYFGLYHEETGEIPVGGLQLVAPDLTPRAAEVLPCHQVWPELEMSAGSGKQSFAHVAHIMVLAVLPEWRGTGIYWLLCTALWRHCVRAGIRDLWLEATPTTLRAYRLLGWPLQIRGALREHWGEPVYPCSLSVREVAGALAERASRSRTYRHILADMVSALPGSSSQG